MIKLEECYNMFYVFIDIIFKDCPIILRIFLLINFHLGFVVKKSTDFPSRIFSNPFKYFRNIFQANMFDSLNTNGLHKNDVLAGAVNQDRSKTDQLVIFF